MTQLVHYGTAVLQCLVNKPAHSEFNVGFVDDGTLGGSIDTVLIVNESKSLGLTVVTSKCELIIDDDEIVQQFWMVALDINHVKTSAVMLLGAPAGDEQSMVRN